MPRTATLTRPRISIASSDILENPDVTLILKALIEESARPLRAIESDFAVDSSGFSTCIYERWFRPKVRRAKCRKSQWVKAHIMCGTTTNVVTTVEVTGTSLHDSPQLPALLKTDAEAVRGQDRRR